MASQTKNTPKRLTSAASHRYVAKCIAASVEIEQQIIDAFEARRARLMKGRRLFDFIGGVR